MLNKYHNGNVEDFLSKSSYQPEKSNFIDFENDLDKNNIFNLEYNNSFYSYDDNSINNKNVHQIDNYEEDQNLETADNTYRINQLKNYYEISYKINIIQSEFIENEENEENHEYEVNDEYDKNKYNIPDIFRFFEKKCLNIYKTSNETLLRRKKKREFQQDLNVIKINNPSSKNVYSPEDFYCNNYNTQEENDKFSNFSNLGEPKNQTPTNDKEPYLDMNNCSQKLEFIKKIFFIEKKRKKMIFDVSSESNLFSNFQNSFEEHIKYLGFCKHKNEKISIADTKIDENDIIGTRKFANDSINKKIKALCIKYLNNLIREKNLFNQNFITNTKIDINRNLNDTIIQNLLLNTLKKIYGQNKGEIKRKFKEIEKHLKETKFDFILNMKFSEFYEKLFLNSKELKEKLKKIAKEELQIYLRKFVFRVKTYVNYYVENRGNQTKNSLNNSLLVDLNDLSIDHEL